jgi:heme oxygenase
VDGFYNQFQTPTLQNFRDSYRYNRDLSYIGIGAVYILQLVDAAVDAHFFDFKITDDLSLNIQPTYQFVGSIPSSQLLFTFKF